MEYADYLRKSYANQLGSRPDKLPFTLGQEYVRLTIVKSEKETQEKAEKFIHQKSSGNVDQFLTEREEIEVKNILKPEEKTRLVLIEGEPGIGKTTLAVELCHQWQNHSLLQQFSLVVLLRLREETVKFATDIKDFFFHPDEKLRDQLVDEIKSSLGENVLLVFDGFDELPIELRQKSLVIDMIKGNKHLPEATVLVTSRPSALAELQPLLKSTSSKHIEIVGFTEESIDKAASKVFDNHALYSNFSAYLSANPVVKAIMYNPLNSALVFNMYNQNFKSERPIPHTLTQLYTELSRGLISSYLNGIGDPLATKLRELEQLPQKHYFQLVKIGELAYNGTVNDNREIFEKLPENCSELGLLIEYCSHFSVSETVKYTFFHKSFQEYLSAFYISQQQLDKQGEFINMSLLQNQTGVVNFVAGLTKIKEVGLDMLHTLEYYKDMPLIFTCFYEAQDVENCNIFLEQENLYMHSSLTGYEMYALGYTVSMCGRSWNLTLPGTTMSGIEMLSHGLKNSTGSIRALDLHSSEGITKYFPLIPQFILQKIENLSLIRCNLTKEDFNDLAQSISDIPHPSLKVLTINLNPGGPGSLVDLIESLKTHTKIEYLSMNDLDIGMEDVAALSDLISSSSSLKWLRVGGELSTSYSKDNAEHVQQKLVKIVLSSSTLVNVEIVFLQDVDVSAIMEHVDVVSNTLESLTLIGTATYRAQKLWHLLK